MLKFFGQIRQRLIHENRFSKYLLYAIGEIALVVIGILIALQINNWNEERKYSLESSEIKMALLNDLRKDSLMLSDYVSLMERFKGQNSNLLERWNQENANKDTLINIVQEFIPTFDNILSFNNNTYQSIVSSGKIALLDSDLQSRLLELKNWHAISLEELNSLQYLGYIKEFTVRYPLGQNNNSYVSKLVWKIDDERDFVMKFSAILVFKDFLLEEYYRRYKETLNATEELIRELEDQL